MIGQLDIELLQQLWWIIASLVGSLFLFLTFVQGGQTLLVTLPRNETEKALIVNSIGRKWELTFTTLVLFGGALFAAFPLFYATSFGGAYWVWIAILFTFVIQAVSFEYRGKPGNVLGKSIYDLFLFVNGSVGILLIGAAVGTFFTGSNFTLNEFNHVLWQHPLRGLEAAFNPFNIALGVFLVFLARVLGALYLANNIESEDFVRLAGKSGFVNLVIALPFLIYVLVNLLVMQGFALDPATGLVALENGKYLQNLLAMPFTLLLLVVGLILVVWGVVANAFLNSRNGIWYAGIGTVFVGMALFSLAAFNNTPFYPSKSDPASSLTIYNASSSKYTLTAMTYVALAVPFVLAYIAYCWRQMDKGGLSEKDIAGETAGDAY